MSRFVMAGDVETTTFDWGSAGMRCAPPGTGCESFVVMDVQLDPGFFHAFHKHPDQDEMIILKSGRGGPGSQEEHTQLGAGGAAFIGKGARGVYPFPLPLVPGSDGAGVRRDTGEEVVVYPGLHWGEREEAPGEGWEILGGPSDGTYAELVTVPEANVAPRPKRLSWEESAVFALGGLTAYRALFSRAGLRSGETVLLLGAGSGGTSLGVSLAAHAGGPAAPAPPGGE